MRDNEIQQPTLDAQRLLQLIVFRVGDKEFGVHIESIQEIIKVGAITPIPDSPDFIKGLINVRGDIVAVIDVKERFSLGESDDEQRHIIIAKQNDNIFGLMVDEVMEILRVQGTDIKPPPHLMNKIHRDYVYGVITHEGRLIILLNLNQVLSEDELSKLASMSRRHGEKAEAIGQVKPSKAAPESQTVKKKANLAKKTRNSHE